MPEKLDRGDVNVEREKLGGKKWARCSSKPGTYWLWGEKCKYTGN